MTSTPIRSGSTTILSAIPAFTWRSALPLRSAPEFPGEKLAGGVALDPNGGPWVVTGAVEKTVEWAGVYEQRESQVTFLELEIVHNGAIVRGWVHQTVPRSGRALLLLRSLHSPSRAAAISALSADRAAATAAKAAAAAEEEDSGRYPDLIASLHAKRQEMAREVMLAERVSEAERETERVEMRRVLAKLREEVATLRRTKVEALVAHQQAEAAHARTEGHLRETVRKLTDAHAAIDDVRGQLVESATAHAAHRETSAERAAEHEAGRTAAAERHRSTEAHLESSLAQLAEAKTAIAGVRQPLVDAVARHAASQEQVAAQGAEIEALRASLIAETARAEEAEGRCEELEERCEELDFEVASLGEELERTAAVAQRAMAQSKNATEIAAATLAARAQVAAAATLAETAVARDDGGDALADDADDAGAAAATAAAEGAASGEVILDAAAANAAVQLNPELAEAQVAASQRALAAQYEELRSTIARNKVALADASVMLDDVSTTGSASSSALALQLGEMTAALVGESTHI